MTANTSTRVIDVSRLPDHAFGVKAPMFWGTLLLMFMEGTGFLLLVASYLYVHRNFTGWPPAPALRLGPATWAVAVQTMSLVPSYLAWRACRRLDLRRTRAWLSVAGLVCSVALALRFVEMSALPFSWNINAYASLVWTTTGLHVLESVASVGDTYFLCAVLFFGRVDDKHFVDVEVSLLFWLFVVVAWLPIYGLFYVEGAVR